MQRSGPFDEKRSIVCSGRLQLLGVEAEMDLSAVKVDLCVPSSCATEEGDAAVAGALALVWCGCLGDIGVASGWWASGKHV